MNNCNHNWEDVNANPFDGGEIMRCSKCNLYFRFEMYLELKKAWDELRSYIDSSGPFPYKAFENLDKEIKQ